MTADNPDPTPSSAPDELQGTLRVAVEQVRAAAVHEPLQAQSLERVRQLDGPAPRQRLWGIRHPMKVACAAASILVPMALALWLGRNSDQHRSAHGQKDWEYRQYLSFQGALRTKGHVYGQADFDSDGVLRDGASQTIVSRIEDVTVPSPAHPSEVVGLVHSPDGRPVDKEAPLLRVPDVPQPKSGNSPDRLRKPGNRPPTTDEEMKELATELKNILKEMQRLQLEEDSRYKAIQDKLQVMELDTLKDPPIQFPPAATWRKVTKLKKVYEDVWGHLPEKDRAKVLEEMIRDLPPEQRKAVEDYFKKLAKGEKPDPKKLPQIWKQHRGRPTFARVYIGDGNSLELVSLQVTTTIEGPRARTVVDHVFRNPHDRRLEGTFEYPLPTEASPSYFAMFQGKSRETAPPLFARRGQAPPLVPEAVASLTPAEMVKQVSTEDWGPLQESRVVNKEKALETYEDVTRARIDPALLEYSGGNTFTGRVFPIAAKGFSRVIIAYEELLPVVQGRNLYRYALPDCKLSEVQFMLQANGAECKEAKFEIRNSKSENRNPKSEKDGRLVYESGWKKEGPGGSVLFAFKAPRPEIQTICGRLGDSDSGPLYLYARVRPKLKVEAADPFADRAVFLLDTSLSEHPDRFDLNMKLLRTILESDPGIKQFNILAFNIGAAWVEPKGWLANTKEGRATAFGRLDGIVLEGATDLSAALHALTHAKFIDSKPLDVFLLSDGQITWGDADAGALAARFEEERPFPTRVHCYRTGLGADNLELFQALTRRGGGIFNCHTEDLKPVARAHRSQCFQVTSVRFAGGPAISDVLVAGRKAAIYPDGELVVAARAAKAGKTTLVVEGRFLGRKLAFEYPIEITADRRTDFQSVPLAPRAWGEVAVASLLSLNDPKLDSLVTAYCQQFGIGSRVASFLILENANDYKRLNLEEERGKTVSGDLGKFLEEMWKKLGTFTTPKAAFQRLLAQIEPRVKLLNGAQGQHVRKLLDLLEEPDFKLPDAAIAGALVHRKDVRPIYLTERTKDRRNVGVYLAEARRRADAKDIDGAVRVLSSIIEEYPARGDALRLVGYRLLDMKQPAHAARLFQQVQRTRPFEPHSYRDLARSLEESGKYGLAAIQYEIVLAGTWHNRFHESLKEVVREEYAHMMRDAIHRKAVTGKLADLFGERLETMVGSRSQTPVWERSDLRVTISWNTDATDVDLWVMEPDGTKCFYENRQTPNGGRLSQDMTQGYGPERYHIQKAAKGKYRVLVHYFSANPNLLAGETHVNVVVTRYAGTPREVVERHTVILKKHGEAVEVCSVEF
jgi:hypothetical protein